MKVILKWVMGTRVFKFLNDTKVPVWFIIVSAVTTFYGTYKIAPELNREFEKNRVQSELALNRMKDLNSSTRELFKEISLFVETTNEYQELETKRKVELLSKFSALQWRAIEIKAISKSSETDKVLLEYQKSLTELKLAFGNAKTPEDVNLALSKTAPFAKNSAILNDLIYRYSLEN